MAKKRLLVSDGTVLGLMRDSIGKVLSGLDKREVYDAGTAKDSAAPKNHELSERHRKIAEVLKEAYHSGVPGYEDAKQLKVQIKIQLLHFGWHEDAEAAFEKEVLSVLEDDDESSGPECELSMGDIVVLREDPEEVFLIIEGDEDSVSLLIAVSMGKTGQVYVENAEQDDSDDDRFYPSKILRLNKPADVERFYATLTAEMILEIFGRIDNETRKEILEALLSE